MFKRVLLLSGTPIISRTDEEYNLVKIVRPDIVTYEEYHSRFCRDNRFKSLKKGRFGVSNCKEFNFVMK